MDNVSKIVDTKIGNALPKIRATKIFFFGLLLLLLYC
jgi:hypothetical protein